MSKPTACLLTALIAVCFHLVGAPSAAAVQSQAAAAALEGTVVDPTAAVVPGATVTATNKETGLTRTVVTDERGRYVLSLLPPGDYTVTVNKEGFAEVKFDTVTLRVGDTVSLEVRLELATLREETIIVAADQLPLIEPTRTHTGTVIDRLAIDKLPLNGRNWTELVLLTPGVTDADDFGNVSFGGADRVSNNVQVDGADNNNAFFGEIRGRTRAPFQFSQETIQEFRVGNNTFAAEFGRAGGGIVNAITRSGTNNWRGSGFYYIRDDHFNANNTVNKSSRPPIPRPKERRQQFGGNLGGPLVRDKLFFFFNYDQQIRNEPLGVILSRDVENDIASLPPAIRARAEAFFFPLAGAVPRDFDQINFFPRLDWTITQNHSLTATHNFQRYRSTNGVFSQPTTDDSIYSNARNFTDSYTTVISLNSVLTPSVVNEFRFNFVFDHVGDYANAPYLPQISVRGFALGARNFLHGRPGEFPGRYTKEQRQQWIDGLSIIKGRHTIKAGFDINRVVDRNYFALNVNGTYSFSSVNDFLQGNFSSFQQRFFAPDVTPLVRQTGVDYGFYMQDTFRLTNRLTLYYGLRYDLQTLPDPIVVNPDVPETGIINEDKNNWGPRFGFAYSPFGDNKTVIRGGYGIFYGRTPNLLINDVLTNNNVYSFNVFLSADDARQLGITFPAFETLNPLNLTAATFGGLSQPPAGFSRRDPFSDLRVFAPDRVNPYIQQGNFEIERELIASTTVAVTYLWTKGTHLMRVTNTNVIPPTGFSTISELSADRRTIVQSVRLPRIGVTTVALRPNPFYRQILTIQSASDSVYHGMALRVNRRFRQGFSMLLSYTLSKAIDNIGIVDERNSLGGFSNLLDPFNARLDRGPSDLDRRHRLVISGIWEMPFFKRANNALVRHLLANWSWSGIATVASGRPISAEVNSTSSSADTDFNEDNVIFDRVPFYGRNAFRGPDQRYVDLGLRKEIALGERKSLEFIYQVFNVANHAQFTIVNRSMYDSARTGGVNNRRFVLTRRNDFLAPISARRNRDMQFGLKFKF
ncbi:MAG: TonB-dependent receptor [Blastocatellia bacterium]|nr:TonB-dependent receptor [Blastocatellia bacterium]